jgi:GNAT superfamily N-acetyltransferase
MPNLAAAYGKRLDKRATRVAHELFPIGTKFQGRGTHVRVASHDINRDTAGKRSIYTHLVGPDNKPAGFARVKATPTRKVKVSMLQLAPEYRRQGLGGAMLNEFATKARSSKDIRRVNWLSAIEGTQAWRKPGAGVRYQRGIAYALSPRTGKGLDKKARNQVRRHKALATVGLTRPSSTIKLSRGAREELDQSLWMATARGGRRGGGMHPAVRGSLVVGTAAGGTGVVIHHRNQVEKSDAIIPHHVVNQVRAQYPAEEHDTKLAEFQEYYNKEREMRRAERRAAQQPDIIEPKSPAPTSGQALRMTRHELRKKRRKKKPKIRKWPQNRYPSGYISDVAGTEGMIKSADPVLTVVRNLHGDKHDFIEAHLNNRNIGYLRMRPGGQIEHVKVKRRHRRKGVATAMFRHAQAVGLNPKHSEVLSRKGRAWAKKVA